MFIYQRVLVLVYQRLCVFFPGNDPRMVMKKDAVRKGEPWMNKSRAKRLFQKGRVPSKSIRRND